MSTRTALRIVGIAVRLAAAVGMMGGGSYFVYQGF